jgi:hypothetical protein
MFRIDQVAIFTSPAVLNTTNEFINPSAIYPSVSHGMNVEELMTIPVVVGYFE